MPKAQFMHTLLAFDFGEKRVGVATGNTLTKTAQALTILTYNNKDQLFEKIEKLLTEWQPEALVVGLPTHPDGQPHAMTAKAKRFANQLQGRYQLSVHLVDERYTSVSVEEGDDALAAQLILEQFFQEM
ncbi:Holliday junction resolvase RuvX [Polynucleobacter sp. MWH-Loch1C5]|uniref:Holliday junction resolvase RuvX n=1 Tax=Polynucleobacter sp. MWH-Loch1C5 TaxID=2689108 RepID=UPI001C0BA3C1|nr:Holliday junction resolvase RuvX [Polynucleobacter sp. MWH-Loch1C5]MBU3542227.1 Holliday junction resolvase RuvX [Polynucleobacter sp. MWH-Loch1C5]